MIGATCACRESVYGLLPLFAPRDSSGRIPISRPELRVVSNTKFEMQRFESARQSVSDALIASVLSLQHNRYARAAHLAASSTRRSILSHTSWYEPATVTTPPLARMISVIASLRS